MPLPRPRSGAFPMRRAASLLVAITLVVLAVADSSAAVQAITDSDGDGLSNAFEIAHGLNPNNNDTNGDGVRDGAEDPDGDGLSNLGEQRFHTDPLVADSNGNGIPDGRDDANHNGIRDGLEQDRRPVPSTLRPSLSKAFADAPQSYRDKCHSAAKEPAIHPCVYGDPQGSRTIAIYGDSHMAQWLSALSRAGKSRHWKIISITKSACPSVHVDFQLPNLQGAMPSCRTWRSRAEAWLRGHAPDLVLISNFRAYRLLDSQGRRIPDSQWEGNWAKGLGQTLDSLPASSQALVLGDTPAMRVDVPACLRKHMNDMAACETARSIALNPAHDANERSVAQSRGRRFASLAGKVCSYDPCSATVNELLIWRNDTHITATYSRQLAPSMATVVAAALP